MTARALLMECLISLNFFCNSTSSSWEMVRAGSLMIEALAGEKRTVVLD